MPKLPVLATVQQSYRVVFGNFQSLWEISLRWVIAAGVAFVVGHLLLSIPVEGEPSPHDLPAGEQVAARTSLSVAILSIAIYVLVVRWHRVIIKGMTPIATQRTALSAGWLYLARSIALGVAAVFAIMLLSLVPVPLVRGTPFPSELKSLLVSIIMPAGFVAAVFIVCRMSLILPGGAIGDFTMTLRKSWMLTRGNGWRMFLGSALSSGPAFVVNVGLDRLPDILPTASGNQVVLTILLIQSIALLAIAVVIQASFLSYAYLFFAGGAATEGDDHIVQAPPALER
jgi:hypothetical protein